MKNIAFFLHQKSEVTRGEGGVVNDIRFKAHFDNHVADYKRKGVICRLLK